MREKQLTGILPIAAAVFDDRGDVDLDGFRNMVIHLLRTGVDAVTLFGLATEFYKLTDEEKDDMMKIMLSLTSASENVAGIVSITRHSWETAVKDARQAEELGADALMLLPPYFLSPSADALFTHMKKVAEAVSIPVIVQYAPIQTGVKISPDVFVRLQEQCENARYVKVETQPPGRYCSELQQQSGGRIKTLVGYAGTQMPDVLKRGSTGIQPGCSFSEIYVALHRMFLAGDMESFSREHQKLLPFISYWMQGVELIIQVEKVILKKRGIIGSSYCRQPGYTLDAGEESMIDEFLETFKQYLT